MYEQGWSDGYNNICNNDLYNSNFEYYEGYYYGRKQAIRDYERLM